MNARHLLLYALLFMSAAKSHATISFLIQADKLKDASGTAMSQSGLVLFVSSTSDSTFGSIVAGSSTALNTAIDGADDRILYKTDLSSYGVNGVLDASTGGLSLASVTNWTSGDQLALLWFPELNISSTTIPNGTPYGFYRNSSAVDGTQAWVTPADPTSNYLLGFFTQDGVELSPGGGAANLASAGNASLTVGAVPEPSRCLLGMIGLCALVIRRRR